MRLEGERGESLAQGVQLAVGSACVVDALLALIAAARLTLAAIHARERASPLAISTMERMHARLVEGEAPPYDADLALHVPHLALVARNRIFAASAALRTPFPSWFGDAQASELAAQVHDQIHRVAFGSLGVSNTMDAVHLALKTFLLFNMQRPFEAVKRAVFDNEGQLRVHFARAREEAVRAARERSEARDAESALAAKKSAAAALRRSSARRTRSAA